MVDYLYIIGVVFLGILLGFALASFWESRFFPPSPKSESRTWIGAYPDNILCYNLDDAIDLAPMIWEEWNNKSLISAERRFGLFKIPGEIKGLIGIEANFRGGFCFVRGRREIWWWDWKCPNPETVEVLWKEPTSNLSKLMIGEER